jgi:predicted nucleic acid-binding Zn ribbon protein
MPLRDVGDGEPRFTSFAEWMAECLLLGERGHGNARPGDDEESQKFAADVRELNHDWQPGQIPHVPRGYPSIPDELRRPRRDGRQLAPVVVHTSKRREHPHPRERRAGRAHSTRAGPSDDPPLDRACEVCGASLAEKYGNARTCGDRCRQRLHRERAALLKRYEAALGIVKTLKRYDERLDLLAAVVWPTDARLSASQPREAV